MLPKIIPKRGCKGYHTVNKKDSYMQKYTGKIPHTVIKVGEDEESEVGFVMSKNFKSPNLTYKKEFTNSNNEFFEANQSNWYLGKNQDVDSISLKKVVEISLKEDSSGNKKLLPNSKLSGIPIRLYKEAVIETPQEKAYSDQIYDAIEQELRDNMTSIKVVFNPKTGKEEDVDIELKPIGYYKPKKDFNLTTNDIDDYFVTKDDKSQNDLL